MDALGVRGERLGVAGSARGFLLKHRFGVGSRGDRAVAVLALELRMRRLVDVGSTDRPDFAHVGAVTREARLLVIARDLRIGGVLSSDGQQGAADEHGAETAHEESAP